MKLPQGGGAIRSIDEKFSVNPATGAASLSIPIDAPPGRQGFGPALSLEYDTGAGNGVFGLGWQLSIPAIARKTARGLPRYSDGDESDTFVLSGAEDLVPRLDHQGGAWIRRSEQRDGFRIDAYRPRIEGLFARIERWTGPGGDVHWRSISRDNVLSVYGLTPGARISDPSDLSGRQRVFQWLLERSFDPFGNVIVYDYKREDRAGVNAQDVFEAHRLETTEPLASLHPKRIRYGNRTPRFREDGVRQVLPDGDWLFELVFDYGEHGESAAFAFDDEAAQNQVVVDPAESGAWQARPDAHSSYRAGYEQRTYRLCRRILVFHHFPELGQPRLVRSTDLEYQENPVASYLVRATHSGYLPNGDGSCTQRSLPPVEYRYTEPRVADVPETLAVESSDRLPRGPGGYRWIDLDGEGIAGLLTEQGGTWLYQANLGGGRLAPARSVDPRPLAELQSGAQFVDLDGDGKQDLLVRDAGQHGFYARADRGVWESMVPIPHMPTQDLDDPNLRLVDLTGDGLADLLVTHDEVFVWYPSLGTQGYGPSETVRKALDESDGPTAVFADGTSTIHLADMSGDGLVDLVRIHNTEVCYWPNLGYGRFGRKVTMAGPVRFDAPDLFDPARLRLADLDGSGTTDILYLKSDRIDVYLNQSGNRLVAAPPITTLPRIDDLSTIDVIDLLGRGTACLVWSSPLPGHESAPLRYLDLMPGGKPHLLCSVANNLGREVVFHYASSTEMYLQDKERGVEWLTRLAFPVHVVRQVETYDRVGKNKLVATYRYRHGFFDGHEREFRGFGLVEQQDTEQYEALSAGGALPVGENVAAASHVPPVLTRTWFHTGAYLEGERISRAFEGEYFQPPGADPTRAALLLPDTVLPNHPIDAQGIAVPQDLGVEERREACRALKGSILRQEVRALDGSDRDSIPYTVSERNYGIHWCQPRGTNRFAVFFVHPRETLSSHCERNLDDPRTRHELTLEVDPYGNVLRQVAIGYGRRQADPELDAVERDAQTATHATLTENAYTNAANTAEHYRTPVRWSARTYELPFDHPPSAGPRSFAQVWTDCAGRLAVPFENTQPTVVDKRLIEHTCSQFRRDDLSAPLPPGQLDPLALPYREYALALTPGLIARVYSAGQIADPDRMLRVQGGYVHFTPTGLLDANPEDWWIPSGRVFLAPTTTITAADELAFARQHFFLPHRFEDSFGASTTVAYEDYDLLVRRTEDPAGNVQEAEAIDYRVLQPSRVRDANANRSEAVFDALGLVVGTALLEGGDSLDGFAAQLSRPEIDAHVRDPFAGPHGLLTNATTRLVYDLFRYWRTRASADPQPNLVATLARERHVSQLAAGEQTAVHQSFLYLDGFGRELQTKVPVEPGDAPLRGTSPDPERPGPLQLQDGRPALGAVSHRWVGTGRTVFNNKGKPVKRYEPFFSATHLFESEREVAETGTSPILFYDPLERLVATLRPDRTYEKVVFTPWRIEKWDAHDTIHPGLRFNPADSSGPDHTFNPADDLDVGPFFRRLGSDEAHWPTWVFTRLDPAASLARWPDTDAQGTPLPLAGMRRAAEARAATLSLRHASTPQVVHLDGLGREFLAIDDAGAARVHRTRTVLDIESNPVEVIDARQRIVAEHEFDVAGRDLRKRTADAGERWVLPDVTGQPLYRWDGRGNRFEHTYDSLRRPTHLWLEDAAGRALLERTVCGEALPGAEAHNLRGAVFLQFDGAGLVATPRLQPAALELGYDFRGNPLCSTRQLAAVHRDRLDWKAVLGTALDGALDLPALAAQLAPHLEPQSFTASGEFDALNRPVAQTLPEGTVIRISYNEAGLLETLVAQLRGATEAGAPVWTPFVDSVAYNARGQRVAIDYAAVDGAGAAQSVTTTYEYDEATYRLTRLRTTRPGPASEIPLQDQHYVHDPAGNVVSVLDRGAQANHFTHDVVSPDRAFAYDALYRLIGAEGREHPGQLGGPVGPDDTGRADQPHPNDGQALRRYAELYAYGEVGNLLRLEHHEGGLASPGVTQWKRRYQYDAHSNRLQSTCLPGEPDQPSYADSPLYGDTYDHDAHGNMTRMPHLAVMAWDAEDQLRMTERGVERTYYVYNAQGQRVRKITETRVPASDEYTKKNERVYLGGLEIYREFAPDGVTVETERQTVHVMDDTRRIALVETQTIGAAPLPSRTRFQLGDHLGTCLIELTRDARVISYEEYFPYGSTSFQGVDHQIEVSRKRYRYNAKERDEETGLYYYGARYYAPWLGRWTAPDPAGFVDGLNLYAYVRANPNSLGDPSGTQAQEIDLTKINTDPGEVPFEVNPKTGRLQLTIHITPNENPSQPGPSTDSDEGGAKGERKSTEEAKSGPITTAGDIARAWEKQYRASGRILEDWVSNDPNLAKTLAATFFQSAMDLGAGFVDVLKLGEGAAKGGWGFAEDAMRAAAVLPVVGRLKSVSAWLRTLRIRPSGNLGRLFESHGLSEWRRFLLNNVSSKWARARYWLAGEGAMGRDLHHWFFPDRWQSVSNALRQAHFNLVELPSGLNRWLGRGRSREIKEGVFRVGLIVGAALEAWGVGTATRGFIDERRREPDE